MPAVSIDDQIAEVEREVRDRQRRYPDVVARGRFKPETAERKIAHLEAAARSLRWLRDNAEWIRAAHEQVKAGETHARHETSHAALAADIGADLEADPLLEHPSVRTVRAAFPEAEVVAIRPAAIPSGARQSPGQQQLTEGKQL